MPGNLIHVEIPATDGERARRFYTALLGWKFGEPAMPGDDYRMTENATPGVAVYTDPEKRGPIVYFAVDDIDAAIRAVRDLGGTAQEKTPVPGQGWFARCVDTEGNPFNVFREDHAAPMPVGQGAPVGAART